MVAGLSPSLYKSGTVSIALPTLLANGTASAAEAIARALQLEGNIVIGKKTYGKGIAQRMFKIYGGGGIPSVGIGKYIGHTHCALMLSTQRRGCSYSEGVICNVCFLYSAGVIL